MSYGESDNSGVPTRAIHDAYLDMQRARKEYRQAKDRGDGAGLDAAHGEVQESVLTFYELLRPHLRSNANVRGYYEGQLPSYNGNTPPDPEDGKGVLQVQEGFDKFDFSDRMLEQLQEQPPQTLKRWHEFLGLNGNTRVVGVRSQGQHAVCQVQHYQLGLKHLDDWGTEMETVQTTLGGFYGAKTETETRRKRVDIPRLRNAARELADVAETLSFLSSTGTPTNDDTRPV